MNELMQAIVTLRRSGGRLSLARLLLAASILGASATSALAVNINNKDAEAYVLIVVEKGGRLEVVVAGGGSASICPSGCFLTLPNGDRLAVGGSETVDITGGTATIR